MLTGQVKICAWVCVSVALLVIYINTRLQLLVDFITMGQLRTAAGPHREREREREGEGSLGH